MTKSQLRRTGVCLAAALAFASLASAQTGPAEAPEAAPAPPIAAPAEAPIAALPVEAPVPAAPAEEPLAEIEETVETLEEPAADPIGEGEASYYGYELAGNRTASGERFNPKALTAAHRTLPLGTRLRVTNKANGKSVIVRVNDRGPFVKKRLIDLSLGAAQQINMVRAGKAVVRLERLP